MYELNKSAMMKDTIREDRRAAIEAAAYALLESKGYAGASMLSIAKAASASNETLYRWYGDKKGLFKSMVQSNAQIVTKALGDAVKANNEPRQCLALIAPILLNMLLGDKAILLNRAAAADVSGELGVALTEGGRGQVMPLIVDVMQRAIDAQDIQAPSPEQACRWYLDLLIGDLQIRRVTGAEAPLSKAAIERRVSHALDAFDQLCKRTSI